MNREKINKIIDKQQSIEKMLLMQFLEIPAGEFESHTLEPESIELWDKFEATLSSEQMELYNKFYYAELDYRGARDEELVAFVVGQMNRLFCGIDKLQ